MIKYFNSLNEKQKNILAIIICVVIIIGFIILNVFSKVFNETKEREKDYTYKEVVDNNRYFTVLSCISKYINYLASNDTDNLIIVLNSDYISNNNITTSNIYNYIKPLDQNYNYDYHGDVMYERKISDSISEYKVLGYLNKVDINSTYEKTFYPLIITLYEDKLIFSVRPGE